MLNLKRRFIMEGVFTMSSANKCSVLLLGTYHMGNPGLDMHNVKSDDVLIPKRQNEIQEVVNRLKLFNPTKIAVEVLTEKHDELNQEYLSYLSDEFTLGASEIYQLGFRIAAELRHQIIYPVDWNEWLGGIGIGDVFEFAQLNMPELYEHMQASFQGMAQSVQESIQAQSIRETLLLVNTSGVVQCDHENYMTIARVGNGKNNIGIDWLSNYWYRRNLIIYKNISQISSPDDRILVIYGAGHIHLLTQFMKESNLYSLETIEKYLDGSQI